MTLFICYIVLGGLFTDALRRYGHTTPALKQAFVIWIFLALLWPLWVTAVFIMALVTTWQRISRR